jgi:CRISPR-associated protein Csd1
VILQQLCDDSASILGEEGLPPPMYSLKAIRWVLSLNSEGVLEGFIPLGGGDKKADKGEPRLAPHVTRSSGIRPILFADTPAYTLGLSDPKAEAKFSAYKEMVAQCAERTKLPEVQAVRRFLESWTPDSSRVPPEMGASDLLTFRVDGVYPVDLPAVQSFWAASAYGEKKDANTGQCLICGLEGGEILDIQPTKIKGVFGGQSAGTDLISINNSAFESFGLKGGATSPVCSSCGGKYTQTLNALIRGERSRLYVGSYVFAFWTADPGFDLFSFVDQPQPDTVKNLLDSYRKGVKHSEINPADFYAASLTANSARAVLRDWLRSTVGEAQDHLAEWFARLETVDAYGAEGPPLSVYRLAASLYRDAGKEMVASVPQALLRAALHGDPLPESLLAQAVKRNRAEQNVNYHRAALMKAVLLSTVHDPQELTRMSKLDPQHPKPAYHCGRLLAELEALQQQAIRGINTTLVDRFYGAASASPASVFGNLLKGAQPHLSVLRRAQGGAYYRIQERLEEILSAIGSFPTTLALRDQADFGLGYYHQRAHNRAAQAEARQAREARNAAETDSPEEETSRA